MYCSFFMIYSIQNMDKVKIQDQYQFAHYMINIKY